jgi:hypothetical protein
VKLTNFSRWNQTVCQVPVVVASARVILWILGVFHSLQALNIHETLRCCRYCFFLEKTWPQKKLLLTIITMSSRKHTHIHYLHKHSNINSNYTNSKVSTYWWSTHNVLAFWLRLGCITTKGPQFPSQTLKIFIWIEIARSWKESK